MTSYVMSTQQISRKENEVGVSFTRAFFSIFIIQFVID